MDPVGPLGSLAHFVEGQLTHLAAVPTVLPGKNTMRNACFFCKPGEPGVLQFFETMNTQIQVWEQLCLWTISLFALKFWSEHLISFPINHTMQSEILSWLA